MKIKTLLSTIKHVNNELKTVRKFAFMPRMIGGFLVWLSPYEQLYVYRITPVNVKIEDKLVTFYPGEWVKLSERI